MIPHSGLRHVVALCGFLVSVFHGPYPALSLRGVPTNEQFGMFICWVASESILDRLGATPAPASGPVPARVAGHAFVEHFLGGEAAAPVRAVRDAVPPHAMHVSSSRAGERPVAAGAVLQLHPDDPVATGSASPSHDCSYVLIF